jgi:hypothetical protein
MAFSELEQKRIEKVVEAYVEQKRPPPHIRAKLDIGFRLKGQSIEIFEIRPYWRDESQIIEQSVAKATYVKTQDHWKVFWKRADLKWHGYEPKARVRKIEDFLKVVDDDAYGCFWG